jgi:hypothetical protein
MWRAAREVIAGLRRLGSVSKTSTAPVEPAEAVRRSFFDREAHGLLDRPHFAYGLARAAGLARRFGHRRLTVCEFGVANGDGLVNLTALAADLAAETGLSFRIAGFDRGSGLPPARGYEDHPELWAPGDFPMEDPDKLRRTLAGRAELYIGDVADTLPQFEATLRGEEPIGFVVIDVDLYSATRSALTLLEGPPEHYLPALPMYFDDVSSFFSNRWCGELRAIEEFNAAHELRKIDRDRALAARPFAHGGWHDRMFVLHVLDHVERRRPSRAAQTADQHRAMLRGNPYGYL